MIAVIFSKDRAMQLHLCLTTFFENVKEKDTKVYVLYTYSNDRHKASYQTLAKEFPKVSFVLEKSFKKDLLKLLYDKMYVLFAVDDCIFCNPFSLCECENLLRLSPLAMGISLRLGENTTQCYPVNKEQQVPDHMAVNGNKMLFNWQTAQYDFNYPLEVSSSIYKMDTIHQILQETNYSNPNELEWAMANNVHVCQKPLLISYKKSVAFCNPINKVQTSNNNRVGKHGEYSQDSLLTEFEKCGRINPSQFYGFVPNGAHQEKEIEIVYS